MAIRRNVVISRRNAFLRTLAIGRIRAAAKEAPLPAGHWYQPSGIVGMCKCGAPYTQHLRAARKASQ